MPCPNCEDRGFREELKKEKGVTLKQYILCRCNIGQELEKLWEKYPAWVGAPYDFFFPKD